MAEYYATIDWQRGMDNFLDKRYSRAHVWRFDGGVTVPGSSSPHSVRLPFSDPAAVDPEEAFVAALSSCHMLAFLYLAAKAGLTVDSYHDEATGYMNKNEAGRLAITQATLNPQIVFSGDRALSDGEIAALHHGAHEECYIANSVKTEITVSGAWTMRAAEQSAT